MLGVSLGPASPRVCTGSGNSSAPSPPFRRHFHPSMTFNVQAQLEDIHIGAWPYTPNYNATGWAYWQTAEVNLAAARTYAVNSGAVSVVPSIGKAVIFSAQGLVLTETPDAETRMSAEPFIYTSINTTAFRRTAYNVSW
jgi:nitrilase